MIYVLISLLVIMSFVLIVHITIEINTVQKQLNECAIKIKNHYKSEVNENK